MLGVPRHGSNGKSADSVQTAADVHAYIDTTEIWFPLLRLDALREISRHGEVKECRKQRTGDLIGYRLIRNQPSQAWLRTADQLASKHRGVLHRVDVAVNMRPKPGLREQIVSTAVLKWSRKDRMGDEGRTVYWLDLSKRNRRNLVLYDDKPNKVTNEPRCVHLELRLYGADVVRRQGLSKPSDLLRLNPKQLFDRHVKWSTAGANYAKNLMRKEHSKFRRRYAGKQLSPLLDRYVSDIAGRVAHLTHRLGLDRSQNVEATGAAKSRVSPPISIPTAMDWIAHVDSLRSLGNWKKTPLSGLLSLIRTSNTQSDTATSNQISERHRQSTHNRNS